MKTFSVFLIAVTLLTETDMKTPVVSGGDTEFRDDDIEKHEQSEVEYASISSRTCDVDRREGVFMFEGDVRVEYKGDTTLCAERLFVFLNASNRFSRLVALDNVSVSNKTRYGTCAMATFARKTGRIDMYGSDDAGRALLREGTDTLEGSHVRFWMNSDVVEIRDTRITVEKKPGNEGL